MEPFTVKLHFIPDGISPYQQNHEKLVFLKFDMGFRETLRVNHIAILEFPSTNNLQCLATPLPFPRCQTAQALPMNPTYGLLL